MATPARPPTVREVDEIVSYSADPGLRNLRITQCYHDLSQAASALVGPENSNWCTFATWASKTAGSFIRGGAESPKFEDTLTQSSRYGKALAMLNNKLSGIHPEAGLSHELIFGFIDGVMEDVRKNITEGNLVVFDQVGQLFARVNEAFAGDTAYDAAKLEAFLSPMPPGPEKAGGQSLLREAVPHYYRAMFETNPQSKAQLILAGNAQVGLYEQTKLQSYIAGALDAPIADGLRALAHEDHAQRHSHEGWLHHAIHSAIDALAHPVIDEVTTLWLDFATRVLMELRLPDGTLHLGFDVPSLPGQPLFPPDLQHITDPDLRDLLEAYDADEDTARGSGSDNWTNLSERMKYIFILFRSRQQDAHLFQQPFTAAQRQDIAAGRMPGGEL